MRGDDFHSAQALDDFKCHRSTRRLFKSRVNSVINAVVAQALFRCRSTNDDASDLQIQLAILTQQKLQEIK